MRIRAKPRYLQGTLGYLLAYFLGLCVGGSVLLGYIGWGVSNQPKGFKLRKIEDL